MDPSKLRKTNIAPVCSVTHWSPYLASSYLCLFDNVPCVLCQCLLQLSVKGYNDKQHILLKKIIEKMATFEIDERRFDIIKEAVRSYCNTIIIIIEVYDDSCLREKSLSPEHHLNLYFSFQHKSSDVALEVLLTLSVPDVKLSWPSLCLPAVHEVFE